VNDEKYIGLDVHQATIVVAVTDSAGKLVMESIQGVPLLFTEEFEVVIMIAGVTEEMHGSDRVPDLNTDCERALVGWAHLQRERNGALFGVHGAVRSKNA
jgi:hypothetical protein